jgi:hypothetical protein
MNPLIIHYQNISNFISDWQTQNVIPNLFESNLKFSKDFKQFLSDSNIPQDIQNEFTKDLN